MLHRPVAAPPIHSANCGCFDCRQRDPIRYARDRRQLRAWAVIFIGLAAALYGSALASLPEIAASFGWGL
jgi:hypothetical protein